MIDTTDPHLHDALFTGATLKLGTLHWYLTRAASQLRACAYTSERATPGSEFTVTHLTSFGKLIGADEVRWWVWTRESDLLQLRTRTVSTFHAAQTLQKASRKFARSTFDTYQSLIAGIVDFATRHATSIDEVCNYASWLHSRDELAPAMLFSPMEWGTTRISDRWSEPDANTLTDHSTIENLTEIAWGFRDAMWGYAVDAERADLLEDLADAYSDYEGTISAPDHLLLPRVANAVLQELSEYFEFIRNSFRNIASAIDQRYASHNLILSEGFWRLFIAKARHAGRVETQTWDFKELLDFWSAPRPERERSKRRFCELVAGFANSDGGVFIVGVRNASRAVIGVADMENRVKHTRQVLDECFGRSADFVALQQVIVPDDAGDDQPCLAIVVAQTHDAKSFTDEAANIWYPLRREAGLVRVDETAISLERGPGRVTNFDFLQQLHRWAIDA
jgi:hypothetical protein